MPAEIPKTSNPKKMIVLKGKLLTYLLRIAGFDTTFPVGKILALSPLSL